MLIVCTMYIVHYTVYMFVQKDDVAYVQEAIVKSIYLVSGKFLV
jgi:hypothetical protein